MNELLSLLERKERLILTVIFLGVIGLLIGDVVEDLAAGTSLNHIAYEIAVMLISLIGVMVLWLKFFAGKKKIDRLKSDLEHAREDLKLWKKSTESLSQGLSQKIDEQLEAWGLSKAEKEVALLMLKGLSNQEIADARLTVEKTVRQQATSIYHKAQLKNRSELSAFFLEDLLVLPSHKTEV